MLLNYLIQESTPLLEIENNNSHIHSNSIVYLIIGMIIFIILIILSTINYFVYLKQPIHQSNQNLVSKTQLKFYLIIIPLVAVEIFCIYKHFQKINQNIAYNNQEVQIINNLITLQKKIHTLEQEDMQIQQCDNIKNNFDQILNITKLKFNDEIENQKLQINNFASIIEKLITKLYLNKQHEIAQQVEKLHLNSNYKTTNNNISNLFTLCHENKQAIDEYLLSKIHDKIQKYHEYFKNNLSITEASITQIDQQTNNLIDKYNNYLDNNFITISNAKKQLVYYINNLNNKYQNYLIEQIANQYKNNIINKYTQYKDQINKLEEQFSIENLLKQQHIPVLLDAKCNKFINLLFQQHNINQLSDLNTILQEKIENTFNLYAIVDDYLNILLPFNSNIENFIDNIKDKLNYIKKNLITENLTIDNNQILKSTIFPSLSLQYFQENQNIIKEFINEHYIQADNNNLQTSAIIIDHNQTYQPLTTEILQYLIERIEAFNKQMNALSKEQYQELLSTNSGFNADKLNYNQIFIKNNPINNLFNYIALKYRKDNDNNISFYADINDGNTSFDPIAFLSNITNKQFNPSITKKNQHYLYYDFWQNIIKKLYAQTISNNESQDPIVQTEKILSLPDSQLSSNLLNNQNIFKNIDYFSILAQLYQIFQNWQLQLHAPTGKLQIINPINDSIINSLFYMDLLTSHTSSNFLTPYGSILKNNNQYYDSNRCLSTLNQLSQDYNNRELRIYNRDLLINIFNRLYNFNNLNFANLQKIFTDIYPIEEERHLTTRDNINYSGSSKYTKDQNSYGFYKRRNHISWFIELFKIMLKTQYAAHPNILHNKQTAPYKIDDLIDFCNPDYNQSSNMNTIFTHLVNFKFSNALNNSKQWIKDKIYLSPYKSIIKLNNITKAINSHQYPICSIFIQPLTEAKYNPIINNSNNLALQNFIRQNNFSYRDDFNNGIVQNIKTNPLNFFMSLYSGDNQHYKTHIFDALNTQKDKIIKNNKITILPKLQNNGRDVAFTIPYQYLAENIKFIFDNQDNHFIQRRLRSMADFILQANLFNKSTNYHFISDITSNNYQALSVQKAKNNPPEAQELKPYFLEENTFNFINLNKKIPLHLTYNKSFNYLQYPHLLLEQINNAVDIGRMKYFDHNVNFNSSQVKNLVEHFFHSCLNSNILSFFINKASFYDQIFSNEYVSEDFLQDTIMYDVYDVINHKYQQFNINKYMNLLDSNFHDYLIYQQEFQDIVKDDKKETMAKRIGQSIFALEQTIAAIYQDPQLQNLYPKTAEIYHLFLDIVGHLPQGCANYHTYTINNLQHIYSYLKIIADYDIFNLENLNHNKETMEKLNKTLQMIKIIVQDFNVMVLRDLTITNTEYLRDINNNNIHADLLHDQVDNYKIHNIFQNTISDINKKTANLDNKKYLTYLYQTYFYYLSKSNIKQLPQYLQCNDNEWKKIQDNIQDIKIFAQYIDQHNRDIYIDSLTDIKTSIINLLSLNQKLSIMRANNMQDKIFLYNYKKPIYYLLQQKHNTQSLWQKILDSNMIQNARLQASQIISHFFQEIDLKDKIMSLINSNKTIKQIPRAYYLQFPWLEKKIITNQNRHYFLNNREIAQFTTQNINNSYINTYFEDFMQYFAYYINKKN